MRARRALRPHAPYGAKVVYVNEMTDFNRIGLDKRLHASKLV